MKKRIPYILLLWLMADIYFFNVVHTLTADPFVLFGYWLLDVLLACGVLLAFFGDLRRRAPQLISWLMAAMLLVFVPKLFALPVLLLEDITRLFRGFPPRSLPFRARYCHI